jgi:hypothetical protein
MAFLLIPTLSAAQNISGSDNEIVFAPYLWGTAIDGTSTVGALPPLDIDASFSDLFSNLNFAMSLHTEFRFDDWVFVIDPTYIQLEMDIELPTTTAPKAEVDMWFVEAWAGYRFAEMWELIGGLRYQNQDISLSDLPSPPLPVTGASLVGEDWVDWFIGTRFTTDLGEKWLMLWRADVVVAGDSDTSWNTSIYFNRRVGKKGNKMLNLGYRYFVDDYNNEGTYQWDVIETGPVLGFTWVF